jgi:hypothetical protein
MYRTLCHHALTDDFLNSLSSLSFDVYMNTKLFGYLSESMYCLSLYI